jgi:glycosyltransferase involved in cell wall biosynthesis
VRTRDLLASGVNWRRDNFAALDGSAPAQEYAAPSRVATALVPDPEAVSWLPFALPKALQLARAADCVLTTSPARSTHLIGLALHRRGLPWLADFRDGWRFEDQRQAWAVPALDRLDAALERTVARAADRCIGVTEPITRDLRERLGARATTITNGFDLDDPELAAVDGAPARDGRHTVVHTGSLAYGGRDPRPVLDALRLLDADAPEIADRLELVFAGPVSPSERDAIEAPDLRGRARALGMLPRAEAIAWQRGAGTLLLLTGDRQVGVATGKLYEYLAARRPVLVLGEQSEAARIVRAAGAGRTAPAGDPRAIAEALRREVVEPAPPPAASALEPYSYAAIARRVAELVADVRRGGAQATAAGSASPTAAST